MKESRFVYITYIRTTPDQLWRALTDPEFTRQYWFETRSESAWKKGASWRLMAPGARIADSGEVLEIDPPRRLVLSWRHELSAELRAEGFSRATFELKPQGDMIKLTVTHEMDKPESKLIEGVSDGWPLVLASLKSFLETGQALEASRHWPEEL